MLFKFILHALTLKSQTLHSLTICVQPQMDDSHKRVNGDGDASKKSSVPSRYQQFMTSEDETHSQSSSAHSTGDDEEEEEEEEDVTTAKSISPVPPQVKSEAPVSPAPAKETSQVLKLPTVDKTDQLLY